MSNVAVFEELIGEVISSGVIHSGDDSAALLLVCDSTIFVFHHQQDCCESVLIEDVSGDLTDLIGSPITEAECVTEETDIDEPESEHKHMTWSFYKFRTAKGAVTVKWQGMSNGCYSEEAELLVIDKPSREYSLIKAVGHILRSGIDCSVYNGFLIVKNADASKPVIGEIIEAALSVGLSPSVVKTSTDVVFDFNVFVDFNDLDLFKALCKMSADEHEKES